VEPGLERSVEGGAVGKMGNGGWKHRENIGKTYGKHGDQSYKEWC
jgi:hypothetical protein